MLPTSTLLGANGQIDRLRTIAGAVPMRAILGLALLIWLPVHLALPLCRDQAIIALVTERILHGFWPYADTWDHKGPTGFLLYLPFLAAIRDVQTAINLGDVVFHGFAYLALRSIACSLAMPWLSGIGLLTLILIVRNDHWTFGQPETWFAMLWLCVLAIFLNPRWRSTSRGYAAAGTLIGLAMMFKPVFGVLAFLPLAIAIHDRNEISARSCILALAGAAMGIAGMVVALFWLNGRLPDLVDAYVTFNLISHAGLAGDDRITAAVRFVVMALAPWFDLGGAAISATAIVGFSVLRRHSPRAALILGGAWIVGLLCVAAQGKSFHYHFAFAQVALAPLVAIGTRRLLIRIVENQGWRRYGLAAVGILGACLALNLHAARALTWWASTLGIMPSTAWVESFCSDDYCPGDILATGAFLRQATPPGTAIFNFGFDAAVYLAADRPPASRYIFSYPLIAQSPTRLHAARAELLATFAASPPAMIVIQDRDTVRLLGERSSAEHLLAFPELLRLMGERYELIHVAGRFHIHRLVH